MSRECPNCYSENEDSAAKCRSCGSVFSGSAPLPAKKSSSNPVLVMTDMDRKSGKVIRIEKSCIIGREGDVDAEFFAEDLHISRRHCSVILENGEFKIEHLSTVTPTKINNIEIGKGIKKIIRSGDHLTIADKTFAISICVDSVHDDSVYEEENSDTSTSVNEASCIEEKTFFVVICPKCGFEYEVQSLDDTINECKNCGDEYDKYEISKVRAMEKYAN